jgi:nucleotide-binding universal stress UspA family protein
MIHFNKILFPTDFSPGAANALRQAIRLAGLSRGEVIVQHVVSNYFDNLWTQLFDLRELASNLDEFVKRSMAEIVDEHSGMTFRQVISKGRPAEEIIALADDEMVDLIVMGSAAGAVTGKVIRLAHQPVLAISNASAGPLNTVLVATDLSPYSTKVIEYAFNLKEVLGARLYLLHVIETPGLPTLEGNALNKMKEWASQKMIGLTPQRFAAEHSVVRLVESGPISDCIAAVARAIRADITIVGTHAYGNAYRQALGTTTDALLSKAPSPVLALKV